MLRGIRTASANWLGRIVMGVVLGLIAISFAIWGIGDIFRGFGQSSLARIGGTEITIEQFRQLYTERLQQMGRQLGRPITMEQARAIGLDRQLVGQLISEATLDQRVQIAAARHLRRRDGAAHHRRPDAAGTERPVRPPAVRDAAASGADHRAALHRRTAPPDAAPAACRHRSLEGMTVPKAALEAADRYQNEQRTIEYVLLTQAQAGEIPEPTPEVLAKYYEDRKALFRAPEYRKIVVPAAAAAGARDARSRSPKRISRRPMKSGAPATSRPSAARCSRSRSRTRRRRKKASERIAKGADFRRHRQGAQA